MKKPKYKKLFNAALAKINSLLEIDSSIEEWTQEEVNQVKQAVIKYFNDMDSNLELKTLPELPKTLDETINKLMDETSIQPSKDIK